jgi:hypothetical protein
MNQRVAAFALAGLSLMGASSLWAGTVELTTRVSGVVETVLVKPGQRVKRGLLLHLARPYCRRASTKPPPVCAGPRR